MLLFYKRSLHSVGYVYHDVRISGLPISEALLIILRLSLNHLTAAPVMATEPYVQYKGIKGVLGRH